MNNYRKKLGFLVLIIGIIMLLPNIVMATTLDNVDEVMKKIAPDLETATFYMKKPTTYEEADFSITGYVNKLVTGDDFYVFASYDMEEDICEVTFLSSDYDTGEYLGWDDEKQEPIYGEGTGWMKQYEIKVNFVSPAANSVVSGYVSKLNKFSPSDPTTFYIISDLSLINYYLTSDKSELWNPGAPGRALKYSTLNNTTKGSNITYYLDVRAGNQDETLMFESAFGPMSVFYNGSLYATTEEGIYLRRIIYIPEGTANTTEAYVAAAQKRINDYLGNNSLAVVSYGGTLASLDEFSEDDEFPVTGHDGNYYNIKIGSMTYKFYIVKAGSDKLVEPTYIGTDIESKIEVTSDDATIPLDAALNVKNVNDSKISDLIGTDNYKSYDITLYSDAKGAKIEKLDNNKFLVKIPVPKELDGKELVVYYITTDNKLEEHEVIVSGGYASFETDHFSVYTLAEASEVTNNPQTSDNILLYVLILIISFIGLGIGIYIKKDIIS